ncbi:MAG TPA: PQQ-dependent sugar dehydrogenase, partial [Leptolinea sp.]
MFNDGHSIKHFLRSIIFLSISFVMLLTACGGQTPVVEAAGPANPGVEKIVSPTPFSPAKLPEPTLILTLMPTPIEVKSLPDPVAYQWKSVFSGFDKPVDLASPPGEADRMVVLEQKGLIRLIEGGKVLPQPMLDIHAEVGSGGSEQGLLGIAFHPAYQQNHFFYVNYTDLQGNTVIARFSTNGQSADPQSEKKLLQVKQPFANHNGGGLAFGPDGFLYIGLGDGGS